MPPMVDKKKCNGCRGKEEPLCVNICPGDLMTIGKDEKAFCRPMRDCWDCMCCTKICPMKAIETRIPYQLGYHGAKLTPFVGKNTITWICTDIYGNEERFKYNTRNTRCSGDKASD